MSNARMEFESDAYISCQNSMHFIYALFRKVQCIIQKNSIHFHALFITNLFSVITMNM